MRSINVFVVAYAFIFILSLLIISLNCEDLVTCFTSVATTLNNVGPGLSLCGPTCNFGFFPPLSKGVLIFDMLAGLVELVPHAPAVHAGHLAEKQVNNKKHLPRTVSAVSEGVFSLFF